MEAVEAQIRKQENKEPKKGLFNSIMKKLSKGEQQQRNKLSTKALKLPKNFANLVLDLEIKVDSGVTDMSNVDALLQLYSVSPFYLLTVWFQRAVEYYSGMNDEKYLYFTERIQNLLCRPDILKMIAKPQASQPT